MWGDHCAAQRHIGVYHAGVVAMEMASDVRFVVSTSHTVAQGQLPIEAKPNRFQNRRLARAIFATEEHNWQWHAIITLFGGARTQIKGLGIALVFGKNESSG